ncbi:MAG: hypothetical protein K9J81_03960 [Desulfohalobiaceae bacterium]|nr:hypothetical protein [Desulfohalobiaceae bacterium]
MMGADRSSSTDTLKKRKQMVVHPGEPPSGTPWELVHGAGELALMNHELDFFLPASKKSLAGKGHRLAAWLKDNEA